MPPDPIDIERRLDAGQWLRPGEVAALLGASRATIHRWIDLGRFRYRKRGRIRFLHPEDVRRELDAFRQEHQGGADGPA